MEEEAARKRMAQALLRAERALQEARLALDRDQNLNIARSRYAAAKAALTALELEAERVDLVRSARSDDASS